MLSVTGGPESPRLGGPEKETGGCQALGAGEWGRCCFKDTEMKRITGVDDGDNGCTII